jgi:hypothetical protein
LTRRLVFATCVRADQLHRNDLDVHVGHTRVAIARVVYVVDVRQELDRIVPRLRSRLAHFFVPVPAWLQLEKGVGIAVLVKRDDLPKVVPNARAFCV